MSAYRSADDGLREKKVAIQSELDSLDSEIKVLDDRIAAKGGALLDRLRVARPCPMKWEDMVGEDTQRLCVTCNKYVYNVSNMTRLDAEEFLESRVGAEMCVQFYRRPDGTIKTTDCAPPPTKRRVFLILAGVGASVVTLYGCPEEQPTTHDHRVAAPVGPEGGAGTTSQAQSPYSTGK